MEAPAGRSIHTGMLQRVQGLRGSPWDVRCFAAPLAGRLVSALCAGFPRQGPPSMSAMAALPES